MKLGSSITVTTRSYGSDHESILVYDFSRFDDDFVEEDGCQGEIFLDELEVGYFETEPE